MEKNAKLKLELFTRGISQNVLAQQSRVSVSLISMCIRGRYKLNKAQEQRIAGVLGKPREDLFED